MAIRKVIENCIAGKRQDQKLLFDEYYSYGFHIAQRYSSSGEDAKEILSNAFIRVFKKIQLFDASRSFENWFATIIVHCSADYYRYKKQDTLDVDEQRDIFDQDDLSIIDTLSYQELISQIMKLSPQYRTVFNLFVVEGYKHREIAEMLGISEGTSKSNLNKAKSQLRNLLKGNI